LVGDADYYEKSAHHGYAKARALEYGNGAGICLRHAARYCKTTADQKNAESQYNYGRLLYNGNVVIIDRVRGVKVIVTPKSDGEGIARDFARARRYYAYAATKGHPQQ
jgi:TPR repeat protein